MKTIKTKSTLFAILVISIILSIQSCVKAPTPAFTFEPTDNPEWGDTIFFTNLSLDATSYSWDFGDGYGSSEMDPMYMYDEAGSYDVTLTATNEKSSIMLTKTLAINEATVLGFIIYEDDQETVIPDCDIWVYDNESDWDNVNIPQFQDVTSNDGIAFFFNLEPQVYYAIIFKETESGMWLSQGYTETLVQNELNGYGIPLTFVPNTKKSLKNIFEQEVMPQSGKLFNTIRPEILKR